jgi:hypothetical protein
MSNLNFFPFSMMGQEEKARIGKAIDQSLGVMEKILDAPMAAKENLMRTEYKAAATQLGFIGRLLQSESASLMAFTVLADRVDKSKNFKAMIAENLPQIQLPAKNIGREQ